MENLLRKVSIISLTGLSIFISISVINFFIESSDLIFFEIIGFATFLSPVFISLIMIIIGILTDKRTDLLLCTFLNDLYSTSRPRDFLFIFPPPRANYLKRRYYLSSQRRNYSTATFNQRSCLYPNRPNQKG